MSALFKRWSGFVAGVMLAGASAALGGTGYTQTNLVSDGNTPGTKTDTALVNPWGLVASPNGPWWVSNNATGSTSIYDGLGNTQIPTITVPGAPTGVVFNGAGGFNVSQNGKTGSPFFIYVGEDGKINGWSPSVNSTSAVAAPAPDFGAVYKGTALGTVGGSNFLYAADFHNGQVRIFDSNFAAVGTSGGQFDNAFKDPSLPAGYAPFNVANIGGKLYVTYALQDADAHDDVSGAGHGFVDVYDLTGKLIGRFASGGALNSPWGAVQAPANFGKFSNDILVGNFGDGKINAFDPNTHSLVGTLGTDDTHPFVIGDLWGIAFGNGSGSGQTNQLFFAAGVQEEAQGLFGFISPSTTAAVPLPPAVYAGGLVLLAMGWAVRRSRAAAR